MSTAFKVAAAAAILVGLAVMGQPALAHPYGPEDEHVYPARCDGCSDDWGSGGSSGYYADGVYYSSYDDYCRRHHWRRYHRRYHRYYGYGGAGYGAPPGYGAPQQGYGAVYTPPGYGAPPAYGAAPAYGAPAYGPPQDYQGGPGYAQPPAEPAPAHYPGPG